MKIRNKILVVLLAMTLTSQGLAWDDGQKKEEDSKRNIVIAAVVVVAGIAVALASPNLVKYFKEVKVPKGDALGVTNVEVVPKTVGIDLGTTNSAVGWGDELFEISEGAFTMPSAVGYEDGKVVAVGKEALDMRERATSVKRLIGTEHTVKINDKATNILPEEVSAEVLRKLKAVAEEKLGHEVNDAVITVPAYFFESQKAATKKAADLAGFTGRVLLIPEPTSALVANGAIGFKESKTALAYDLGGGTMDVSVINVISDDSGKNLKFDVEGIAGDPKLGGDDFDEIITEKFFEKFNKQMSEKGIELSDADKVEARRELLDMAEEAKIKLSNVDNYTTKKYVLGYEFETSLTRKEFETSIENLVQKTIDEVHKAIDDAGMTVENINEVFLVGGSSRIPLVREKLIKIFSEEKLARSLASKAVDPDEAVAKGAAIYAKFLDTKAHGGLLDHEIRLMDIAPLSIWLKLADNKLMRLVKKGESIPLRWWADTEDKEAKRLITKHEKQTSADYDIIQGEVNKATKPVDEEGEIFEKAGNFKKIGGFKISKLKLNDDNKGEMIFDRYVDENGILKLRSSDQHDLDNKVDYEIDRGNLGNLDEGADTATQNTEAVGDLTPEQLEQAQQQQQEEFLQQLLKGVQNKEGMIEEVQVIAKGQEEVRELLNKVLEDNKLTHTEIKELKEKIAGLEEKLIEFVEQQTSK